MTQAYIVEALRTAGGRRGGALKDWHPADLGAAVLDSLVGQSGIDPAAIDAFAVESHRKAAAATDSGAFEAEIVPLAVDGGAIALGHPLGASGTKLMATLVHALHAHGGRFGLQTMCEGGGIANVTIVERV